MFGRYVVSQYYGDLARWVQQRCYLLADKDTAERFVLCMQSRYNFLYWQNKLKVWTEKKIAKEIYNFWFPNNFRLKVGNRIYKQTAHFTLDTYKR